MNRLNRAAIPLFDCLRWSCALGGAWFVAAFAYVALLSMHYPFNLEWMEGQTMDVMQRVLDGLPLYAEPSLDYVAFIYTPLYYYVSAFVALFTGVDFFPARLVSVLAALGSAAVIYAWIRRENGGWQAGLAGAGLFMATYRLSGRWFDNARVDSLFLFLTLLGLYVFWHYRGWRSVIASSVLLAAAFFTKQSALLMALPVLGAFLFVDWRHALRTGGVLALLLAVAIASYEAASGGWFSFFVFTVPSGHAIAYPLLWNFWKMDLLPPLGILMVIGGVTLLLWGFDDWRKGLCYSALAVGFLGAAYVSRLHMYGYINVLMPAHAALALLAGLSYGYFAQRREHLVQAALSVLLLVQMYGLLYNPQPLIPSQKSLETGNKFLEELGKVEGEVFIPELQFVQTRVGKKSYALGMAAFDLLRANLRDRKEVKKKFEKELAEAIASGRFSAVMPGKLLMLPRVFFYYKYEKRMEYPREYVTGAINFLRTDLYLRKPETSKP